ncbi:Uncharacterised protein [Pantoea agglomerans]|uniref:Uncharacterized protein n=1 Tax=Enterobacter agglomerans TaxID=549 RepID=A0A379AHE6_ENTAG|nr:Uncharacterised protein [Pantoea agglomerans]
MLLDVYGGLSLVTPVISPGLVSKVELTGRLKPSQFGKCWR